MPYTTIKCGIIKSVKDRPLWTWQEYWTHVYCVTGFSSHSVINWRKLFWSICIAYMKQNITLYNTQVTYLINTWPWWVARMENNWNFCSYPKNICPVYFPPLKFIFSITWLPIQLLDSQGMFFAPWYGEGDDKMPHRYNPHSLFKELLLFHGSYIFNWWQCNLPVSIANSQCHCRCWKVLLVYVSSPGLVWSLTLPGYVLEVWHSPLLQGCSVNTYT